MATATSTVKNSTTVRSIQKGLRGLAIVSPPLAGRVASWLFFRTPPRLKVREREQAVLDRGRAGVFRYRRETLKTWHWGEQGPLVILVHGWGGRAAQMTAFVAPLVDAGHRVLAIDMTGHGDSPGSQSSIPAIADILVALGQREGDVRAVVAHSLGSSAAILAMARGLTVGRYVGIAGPLEPERWFRDWVGSVVSEPNYLRERARIEARSGSTLQQLHGLELAQSRLEPMLWVHDHDDKDVPFESGRRISEAWRGARLLATRELGHRRILADPDVVEAVTRFVSEA